MTAPHATTDPTMEEISASVTRGRDGDVESARQELLAIWHSIGVLGDPLHRCTLAHHLADLYETPAESLVWDIRALDAADALTNERAQRHHASLDVSGFYPSLYLNLADNFRRLGTFPAAADSIASAEQHVSALPDGPYGDTVRTAIGEVRTAIDTRHASPRESAPGPHQ